jgi:hypothetical protein
MFILSGSVAERLPIRRDTRRLLLALRLRHLLKRGLDDEAQMSILQDNTKVINHKAREGSVSRQC